MTNIKVETLPVKSISAIGALPLPVIQKSARFQDTFVALPPHAPVSLSARPALPSPAPVAQDALLEITQALCDAYKVFGETTIDQNKDLNKIQTANTTLSNAELVYTDNMIDAQKKTAAIEEEAEKQQEEQSKLPLNWIVLGAVIGLGVLSGGLSLAAPGLVTGLAFSVLQTGVQIAGGATIGISMIMQGMASIEISKTQSQLADAQRSVGAATADMQKVTMYYQFVQQLSKRQGGVLQSDTQQLGDLITVASTIMNGYRQVASSMAQAV